jgi:hypothetical protein
MNIYNYYYYYYMAVFATVVIVRGTIIGEVKSIQIS